MLTKVQIALLNTLATDEELDLEEIDWNELKALWLKGIIDRHFELTEKGEGYVMAVQEANNIFVRLTQVGALQDPHFYETLATDTCKEYE